LNHSLVASCAGLTRASIYFAKSLLKLDGLPGQGPALYALWFRVRSDETIDAFIEHPEQTDIEHPERTEHFGRPVIPIRVAAE